MIASMCLAVLFGLIGQPSMVAMNQDGLAIGAGRPQVAAPLGDDSARTFVPVDAPQDGAAAAKPPAVWIGVRLTPVPEPLAAHLNRSGLMVANLVNDSPADRAGLQRYDVVVSFNNQPVHDMDDLLKSISDVGADKRVPMTVIRGGKETSVEITPAQRPTDGEPEFKYEEPQPEPSDMEHYFGGRMKQDPSGNWIFEPLGRLRDLPEALHNLRQLDPDEMDMWMKSLHDAMNLDPSDVFRFKFGADMPFAWWDDADAKVEVRVSVNHNGESLTVHRSAEGEITVERRDRDGDSKTTVYENAEELQKGDAEAYELLMQHSRRGPRLFMTPPALDRLPARQRDFQQDVQRSLSEAERKLREAVELSRKARAEAHARSAETPRRKASQSRGEGKNLSISISDGRVSITLMEDGKTESYEYDSVDELRQENPELYERVKGLLEQMESSRADDRSTRVACG